MAKKKSTSTTGPSKQALPYITSATNAVTRAYNNNADNLANISGALGSLFNSAAGRTGANDPNLSAASGYVRDVLGGKYQTGNPQLDAIIANTNSDVTDQVNAIFGRAGTVGSSRYGGELSKQLASNETNLRYKNYSDEMDRMANAAGLATNISSAENQDLATLGSLGELAANLPTSGAQGLADAIARLWGNSTTSTQKQAWGPALLAGAGAAAGAYAASDRRLKRAIQKVGEFADGLGIYEWQYVWGGPRHRGVMADEVEKLRPWALGPKIAGEFASVNYGAL